MIRLFLQGVLAVAIIAIVNAYPDPSTYCSAGEWIAPALSDTSNF